MSRYVIAFLGNIFPPVVAIATAPILAQALGVFGRGEAAAAVAPLMLALAASTFGLTDATVHAVARRPNATVWVLRRASVLIAASGAIATVVILMLTGPLSGGNARIVDNMILASLSIIPSLITSVLRSAAMGLHRWWDVTISRTADSAVRLVAIASLAIAGQLTVSSATIVIAFAPVLGGLTLLRVLWHLPRPQTRDDGVAGYRPLASFGVKVWIGAASGVLLSRIDQVLMVPLAGATALGLYVVAVSISEVPLVANSAVREVIFASEAGKSDDARVGLASRLSTIVTATLALVIGVSMPLWLGPLFGSEFEAAMPVAILLLVAVTAGNPGSVAGAALSARGHPGLRSLSLIIASIVNVALLVLLVPAHGAQGAAIATLVGNLVASNGNIYFLWRRFGISPVTFYAIRSSDLQTFFVGIRRLLCRGELD